MRNKNIVNKDETVIISHSFNPESGTLEPSSSSFQQVPLEGCKGSLIRLTVTDFMSYDAAELRLGPNVNIIQGGFPMENTAILNAICLGLGENHAYIVLDTSMKEYIRHGASCATIEIELFNPDGGNYVIKRCIKRVNDSVTILTWYMAGVEVSLQVIEELKKSLNIRVDGLSQLLILDEVVSFRFSNNFALLEYTEKAYGNGELFARHKTLIQLAEQDMETVKVEWLTSLNKMIQTLNTHFGKFCSHMGCSGNIQLFHDGDGNDFSKYGIRIEFESNLNSERRSLLWPAMYFLSLQQLTPAPFLVIRGTNEVNSARARYLNWLCSLETGAESPQYLLLTSNTLPPEEHPDTVDFHALNKVPPLDTSKSTKCRKQNRKQRETIQGTLDYITVLNDGDPVLYQCNVCQKRFKSKPHIHYHKYCWKGEKPFKCDQCGQGFIAKSHYEFHLRTHTGERPFICPKCGKGFKQRSAVTRHMRSHTGEKPHVCSVCYRGFAAGYALRSHTLIHTGERPFACTYCNKRFTGMTNLKRHVMTHTGERPFRCKYCEKSFGLRWTLDLHLRTHSSERPYACDQCSGAFSTSAGLRRHLIIHSGEWPFKCWVCGTAFRRKYSLDRHLKSTHNQPKEFAKLLAYEAAAEYLKETAKNRSTGNIPVSNLKKHVITHAGQRPFSCNHCGKSFGLRWTLDLHLRTHSIERPYACDQCSRAFSTSAGLRRHLIIHSDEWPFKCWVCGTGFRRKYSLDRNLKSTHNQPKEFAKLLAYEAAAEYMKETDNNRSTGNFPVSKLNSAVISNVLKNADLIPAGGIVPRVIGITGEDSAPVTSMPGKAISTADIDFVFDTVIEKWMQKQIG